MRALMFAAALLVLGAAPAGAGIDLDLDEPDPVSILEGVAPTEIGAAAETATGLYVYLEATQQAQFVEFAKGLIMHDHWLRIGRCEQPGNGYGGVDWQGGGTNPTGLYYGGLGISAEAWAQNAPADFPADGRQATMYQQMFVATRIYAYAGLDGWGCK